MEGGKKHVIWIRDGFVGMDAAPRDSTIEDDILLVSLVLKCLGATDVKIVSCPATVAIGKEGVNQRVVTCTDLHKH